MNSGIIPGNAGGAEMNGRHAKGGIHGNSLNDRAAANFAYLYRKLIRLYANGSGSVTHAEAAQLLESLSFVLELGADGPGADAAAIAELGESNPDELFRRKQIKIATRVDKALETWRLICETMTPLRNVSLRDTLASIGGIKSRYDTYFAAPRFRATFNISSACPPTNRFAESTTFKPGSTSCCAKSNTSPSSHPKAAPKF